ncbi:hypothetical protein R6Q59_025132 [Mikania micrantha]
MLEWYNLIMKFDLATEEFSEVGMPDEARDAFCDRLSEFNNKLVLISQPEFDVFEAWVIGDGLFTSLYHMNAPNNLPRILQGFREPTGAILGDKDRENEEIMVGELLGYPKLNTFVRVPQTTYALKEYLLLLLDQQQFHIHSFFNYYVPDLNEETPVEYSYGTIDLNAEPNADVGFDSQASYAQQNDYGFVYDDSKQSNLEEAYEEKPADSNINWETKEVS